MVLSTENSGSTGLFDTETICSLQIIALDKTQGLLDSKIMH